MRNRDGVHAACITSKHRQKPRKKPPKPDAAVAAAAAIAKAMEAEWERESPLKRAQRQKAHGHKSVLGMSDGVFYKHLRDHNLEAHEAQEEVHKRKWLIREGRSDAYKTPEIGNLVLGLLNGVPLADPAPPEGNTDHQYDEDDVYAPWIHNPWDTYLKSRLVANSGLAQALVAF